jgi:hypothetical protein
MISNPTNELHIHKQIILLHSLALCLNHLGVPPLRELTQRFSSLASRHLPPPGLMLGMSSGLYHPTIHTLERSFPQLSSCIEGAQERYGRGLSARDTEDELIVPPPPPVLLTASYQCDDNILPFPGKCREAARCIAKQRIVPSASLRVMQLCNFVAGAYELERASEKKANVLSTMEVGPSLQLCRHLFPKDLDCAAGYFPLKLLQSEIAFEALTRSPPKGPARSPLGDRLILSESVKKERARETFARLLFPFATS